MALDLILILALNSKPNSDYLNEKSKEHHVNISYITKGSIEGSSGFYPIEFDNEKSGFEIYEINYSEVIESLPEPVGGFPESGVAYQFRFGSSNREPALAFYTSAFLSEIPGTLVFETQGGRYMTAIELIEAGRYLSEMEN